MTMIIADDFSPILCGDTGAPFDPLFLHKDGSVVDLTGATISMIMEDSEGNVKIAMGTFTVTNAAGGQASYSYAASDVNTAGSWTLYIAITIGGKPIHADKKTLNIEALPTP